MSRPDVAPVQRGHYVQEIYRVFQQVFLPAYITEGRFTGIIGVIFTISSVLVSPGPKPATK